MPAPELLERLRDYLVRQIAWLEETLRALAALTHGLSEESLHGLVEEQTQREKRWTDLQRERRGLLHEWQQDKTFAPDERAAIRRLDRRALDLAEEANRRFDEAALLLEAEKTKRREALDAVRRGKGMIAKFRPGLNPAAGFIDKKA